MTAPGTCRLCHSTGDLRDSHVLPELLYKPSYDSIHRALELNASTGGKRFLQKGYRERLLCDACEGRIQKFEDYFARAWMQGGLPTHASNAVVSISGLDYALFKLFHLSIVWRASISQRSEFKSVRLGPHEEPIRDMLLRADPGPPGRYPFSARLLIDPTDRRVTDDVIVEPILSRAGRQHIFIFTFGGCSWQYFIAKHDPGDLVPVRFGPGTDFVTVVQDLYTYPPLADFAPRYRSARSV